MVYNYARNKATQDLIIRSISSCIGDNSLFSMRLNSWTKNIKCLNDVFR